MQTAADWSAHDRLEFHHAGRHLKSAGRPATPVERWILARIFQRLGDSSLRLVLWDGSACGAGAGSARSTVTICDRRMLLWLALQPDMAFGDGYSEGRISVTGDLKYLLEVSFRLPGSRAWPSLPANTLHRSRENVHRHYDLGNDFYQSWLDESLVYTCAYFDERRTRPACNTLTLEEAQQAKLELVCRKLALEPGQHVIEAGCGWGALAIYMARHYGVTVRAYNISSEQVAFARARAKELGVAKRVLFVEDDYRTIAGSCDRFVSVGMVEHVGLKQFEELGAVIDRVLHPEHGRGLLHFVGRNHHEPLSNWITTRIFPGAYPPTLSEVSGQILEPRHFSITDVENLRQHYALTLDHWLERYEQVMPRVAADYGERFARAWQLYLMGSGVSFRTGHLQLFQVTFARARDNTVPMTRRDLYAGPH